MFSIFWPLKLAVGLVRMVLNLLVLLSCVLTITAFMGDRGWVWSLTTHFRVQYLTIQLIALTLTSLGYWFENRSNQSIPVRADHWLTLVFLMFFAGLNLTQIAPYYWPMAQTDPQTANAPKIKLMHFNLFGYLNLDRQLVIDAIRANKPDMVDLVEYTGPWQRDLEKAGVFRQYPYRIAGKGDIALYSKIPLKNAHLTYAAIHQKVANQANIIAQFKLNRQPVTILVAHPASPIMPSHLAWQQESFQVWRKERNQLGKNLLIVGDLNTAPWSVEFAKLTQDTGLRDSQLGYGLQPSWPTFIPFKKLGLKELTTPWTLPFLIPIDHVLVSKQIQVLSRKTGPFVGSDHLPVIIELGLQGK